MVVARRVSMTGGGLLRSGMGTQMNEKYQKAWLCAGSFNSKLVGARSLLCKGHSMATQASDTLPVAWCLRTASGLLRQSTPPMGPHEQAHLAVRCICNTAQEHAVEAVGKLRCRASAHCFVSRASKRFCQHRSQHSHLGRDNSCCRCQQQVCLPIPARVNCRACR